jgi:hypothetical protein
MADTPWIGLAALAAPFLLPLVPDWVFEGPRTIKHWPRRHICGNCQADWTDDHTCQLAMAAAVLAARGELRRIEPIDNQPRSLLSRSRQ